MKKRLTAVRWRAVREPPARCRRRLGIEGALAEDGFAAGHFRRGDGHSRELGLFQGHAESKFLFLEIRAFLGGFIAVQQWRMAGASVGFPVPAQLRAELL